MTDNPQTDQNNPSEAATSSPTPSRMKHLRAAGGLVAGAVVGTFLLGPAIAPGSAGAASDVTHESASHGEPGAVVAQPHMIENLVVNPAGSRGTRFLLLSVGIIMSDPVADDELRRRDAEARDRVVQVLSAINIEELVDVSHRDAIRRDLARSLDSLFTGGARVKTVLLPQFVIQ